MSTDVVSMFGEDAIWYHASYGLCRFVRQQGESAIFARVRDDVQYYGWKSDNQCFSTMDETFVIPAAELRETDFRLISDMRFRNL